MLTGSEAWVTVERATAMIDRPKRTIYKWIKDGEVRTMRPLHDLWVHIPDLTRMDKTTQRRKRRDAA